VAAGAPEALLQHSVSYLANGQSHPLAAKNVQEFEVLWKIFLPAACGWWLLDLST
jgi:hypothetical protein